MRCGSVDTWSCLPFWGSLRRNSFLEQSLSSTLCPRASTHSPGHLASGTWLITGFVPLAATLYLFRYLHDRYASLCAIYAVTAIVFGVFFSGGQGVAGNAMFDASIAVALGAGVFINRIRAGAVPPGLLGARPAAKFTFACAVPIAIAFVARCWARILRLSIGRSHERTSDLSARNRGRLSVRCCHFVFGHIKRRKSTRSISHRRSCGTPAAKPIWCDCSMHVIFKRSNSTDGRPSQRACVAPSHKIIGWIIRTNLAYFCCPARKPLRRNARPVEARCRRAIADRAPWRC